MVSRFTTFSLMILISGIAMPIPKVIFADSSDIPTPTPFQSYYQKKQALFNQANQQPSLSDTSASLNQSLSEALSPANTLLNGLLGSLKSLKGLNLDYSSFNLPKLPESTDTGQNDVLNGIRNNISSQEALSVISFIKDGFVLILKIFLATLNVVTQIIRGILSFV
ncbi:MAG: hypothetical protein A3B99_00210 [Candidatus Yanofskybacteria bacterium RIFCSPHIGHO2_02_FULL_44_12b]|uniref:Uncharacterized protein n=2 Tax=Candidatus Yanofskyibacteriota TaxID=1752733 RepID=A0A1F8GLN0_9BACT|nr:MAG: hypothetical protein A2659_01655 [Candidatus Yanofskybacteria bacterium RIFCSPHIGHO2_01_FULL_44_24]OGN14768.1 MAG: hypothetical protein A3B99_00210 [Candidatus Yanofskybacteria bacterium RIFCSPHIGHO2_02_FULL_44_12b]OGN25900.1 MAG: hypothetical protein A2925_02575 [Candidatus Yanofskybacteria bacterium RIFCSPLOWO2_01_FULL_44_22]